MDIGRIKVNQSNFDGALDDFSRAVTLLQEYDPLNQSELAIGLEWIASIWNQKHVSIAKTISILAQGQPNRHEYQLSLIYEMKYYSIIEKNFSPDRKDVINSLTNIAQCYEHLNELEIALKYYQRSFSFDEKQTVKDKIDQLSTQINEE
ncbi:unnamed protein product [Adineta steineri]|nr:unnamed protein product [Adineta steineri]